jgi:hypothetical protein
MTPQQHAEILARLEALYEQARRVMLWQWLMLGKDAPTFIRDDLRRIIDDFKTMKPREQS